MKRIYTWPTLVNCVLPAFFVCLAAAAAGLSAENLLSNRLFGVPSIYPGIALICVALFSIFRAHFNHSVADGFVWAGIVISGLALILFFAFLHQGEGIICTAPLCPNTTKVMLSDPRFLTPIGETHEASWLIPALGTGTDALVDLDQSFTSNLYYSTVTFTTLGYGDFQPVFRMRVIPGIEAIIGYGYLGMVVGLLIDLGNRD